MGESIASYRLLIASVRVFDIGSMMACFLIAVIAISPDIEFLAFSEFLSLRLRAGNVVFFAIAALGWGYLFSAFNLYSDLASISRKTWSLAKAITLGSLLLWALALLFGIEFVNSPFMLLFWACAFASSGAARILLGYILKRRASSANNRTDFLVVGVNPRSIKFVRSAESDPRTPRNFIGFVDLDNLRDPIRDGEDEYAFLTNIGGLKEFLRRTRVDEVVLSLPLKSFYDEASNVISVCEEQGITVRVLADVFQTKMTHSYVEAIGGHSVITVATHEITGFSALVKRTIDITLGFAILAVLSPVFIFVSMLVALTSRGPVLFSQERVGLNKKIFRMLKFRSMVAEAELQQGALESLNEAQGPVFKIHHDPRITRVGRFLRKSSIDELPQLINVIKGDMSLVGPRPLPLRDYAGFEKDWHRGRLSVRPGITGLWQVKDRDHTSFDNWMKLDMQYIDQWSLGLDFKILLQTIPAVLRGSGE